MEVRSARRGLPRLGLTILLLLAGCASVPGRANTAQEPGPSPIPEIGYPITAQEFLCADGERHFFARFYEAMAESGAYVIFRYVSFEPMDSPEIYMLVEYEGATPIEVHVKNVWVWGQWISEEEYTTKYGGSPDEFPCGPMGRQI